MGIRLQAGVEAVGLEQIVDHPLVYREGVAQQRRTGGGGIVALNRLEADGSNRLTVMLINGPSATLAQLLGSEGKGQPRPVKAVFGSDNLDRHVHLAH